MELRELLLTGHILGAIIMGFGSGTAMLAGLSIGPNPDLRAIIRTVELENLGGRVTAYAAIVVLLLGIWLVIEVDTFEFSQPWISAAFTLWLIAMGIGGGVLGSYERRVLKQAREALGRGETTNAQVTAAFNAPVAKIGGTVLGLMYVVFVWLMVAKPGL